MAYNGIPFKYVVVSYASFFCKESFRDKNNLEKKEGMTFPPF